MCLRDKAKVYLDEITTKWKVLQGKKNVFAYDLNVRQHKYLPGSMQKYFFIDLNPERSTKRRLPQTIPTIDPIFDKNAFNFQKIDPSEQLMNISHEGIDVSLIINNSPLTPFHTLICPDVNAGHAQRITQTGLSFCIKFLLHLSGIETAAFRIGYNSPGALASVNHLHMHLIYVDADLYIDKVDLELLSADNDVYRLSKDMPTEAVCFLFNRNESEIAVESKIEGLYVFLMWLCQQNMPHNLFITPDRGPNSNNGALKVFIYARENYCFVRDTIKLNLGFCELSGYLTVGDKDTFDTLTEGDVILRIKEETGAAYKKIYQYFKKDKC